MIVITGATGNLGRLVVAELLGRVPAGEVVAAVRNPDAAADLGVRVREADYDRPETLRAAFDGAEAVLLISGSEIGRRVPQHQAVVDAAKEAGVARLVYTSVLHADTSPLSVAPEHQATEEYIRASGLSYTLLRNGWYNENYLAAAKQGAESGVILGSARDGRVASASRADYAAAAATVLTGDGHRDAVYELSGDTAWSMPEFAAEVATLAGRPVTYRDLPVAEYAAALADAGLPEPVATMLSGNDTHIAEGWLADTPGDLAKLIGRQTTPLRDTLAGALRG